MKDKKHEQSKKEVAMNYKITTTIELNGETIVIAATEREILEDLERNLVMQKLFWKMMKEGMLKSDIYVAIQNWLLEHLKICISDETIRDIMSGRRDKKRNVKNKVEILF